MTSVIRRRNSFTFPWDVTKDGERAGGRVEKTGKHLERRRFAGAVWAEESDDLTRRQIEGDPVDGAHLLRAPTHQARHRGPHAGFPLRHGVDLGQVLGAHRRQCHGKEGL
jgi:hypothetical protein